MKQYISFDSHKHYTSAQREEIETGKTRCGRLRREVNRYLKWAFIEASNSVARNRTRRPDRHVSQLYARVRKRRGHPKAVGAVARHLAEACFHVLVQEEPYRDPTLANKRSSQRGASAGVMSPWGLGG